MRSEEGYLAEVVDDDAGLMLVEHHCPIRDAAASCGALCGAELDVFRRVLGPGVTVTRTQHVLAGDRRCAYRVEAADDLTTGAAGNVPGMADFLLGGQIDPATHQRTDS